MLYDTKEVIARMSAKLITYEYPVPHFFLFGFSEIWNFHYYMLQFTFSSGFCIPTLKPSCNTELKPLFNQRR